MRHILFTLQGCAYDPLDDKSYIEVVLKETAEICKSISPLTSFNHKV